MIVWELNRCEEYWMQESLGLFETKEAAINYVKTNMLLLLHCVDDGIDILITHSDHYAKPDITKVVASKGIEVTCDNISKYTQAFDFHNIIHRGYNMLGVFPREVQS